ncbi:hypothetical protein IJ135_01425 [Candidatus Saccharibacteria bacterium]|nr:hypothetical protein [Candidatus Saccharibacteria bacterium]
MTIEEATIQMIRGLPETMLLEVQTFIQNKALTQRKKKSVSTLRPYTRTEFIKLTEDAIQEYKRGEVYSREDFRKHVRKKYGFEI